MRTSLIGMAICLLLSAGCSQKDPPHLSVFKAICFANIGNFDATVEAAKVAGFPLEYASLEKFAFGEHPETKLSLQVNLGRDLGYGCTIVNTNSGDESLGRDDFYKSLGITPKAPGGWEKIEVDGLSYLIDMNSLYGSRAFTVARAWD